MLKKLITQVTITAFAVVSVSFLLNDGDLALSDALRDHLFSHKVLVTTVAAQSNKSINKENKTKAENKIELPQDFQYPNGITQASDGTIYVGSIVSGQILQIAPDGTREIFFPGSESVFAATSLRLDEQRGILWGTSPDFLGVTNADGEIVRRPHRVFALDTSTGEVIRSLSMPDNGFGNDIALDSDGGVYVTDSFQPRIHYLAPEANQFETWVEDELFRPESEKIGLAGIARHDNGTTIVGMYSRGDLLKIMPQPEGSQIELISLERPLENPDGMQFAPDGSLLLTEGAMESGDGRLVRIDVLSPGTEPKPIETLASGFDLPVNLTTLGNNVWVTVSRLRHRLLPEQKIEIPDRFFVHHFVL
ncbi:SMP-30/Gluconolaconase/LRE domain protein [Hyella patelloides LEGE 07179]|uniref:SMP-30/Gluconolaconase/LRE domain protein n=1 Tax=Hyella patelloides LEGE 07179 TaxID=945734 RepID=A0A563W3M7_9CYAN|nr:gluconolaconase [Hyella patelloides]VEP18292.1 SMP-30/Gluconolaconase/LRE domain protein [Hyella patelloides LEGE 07179]